MRRLTLDLLPDALESFRHASTRSMFVLTSQFGNSRSEWEQQIDDGCNIYISTDGALLLQIAYVDSEQASARFQLCGTTGLDALNSFLNRLVIDCSIDKLYSYVFPWESEEIDVLKRLGFDLEAILREHLYLLGSFQDIEVYGRMEDLT